MASRAANMPRPSHVFVAGLICLGMAISPLPLSFQIGFALCGVILWLFAAIVWLMQHLCARAALRMHQIAKQMMAHDLGVGFVTDAAGVITFANRAAHDRFGQTEGRSLPQVFGRMLANPTGILNQLVAQAVQTGAQTEDIVTRGGHFRLRILMMGESCQLWWLDDLSDGAATGRRAAKRDAFPMLSATAAGQIIQMSDGFRRLVGAEAQTLEDVFKDLPLRSGFVHRLRGTDGTHELMVAVIEGRDNTHDVYLLPGVAVPQVPRQLEAGWDAVEDLPVPLLKIARDGRLLGSNREARHLLHISSSQGQRLSDVLDGPGRPINDWLAEALAGQEGHVSQFLRGRGGSRDKFVQVTLNTAGAGADLHLIAVLNDVTELKTLEAQFVQSQKMQAIGQLAGGVAHDFNNLLTAISGHCDLLLLRHDEGDQNYGDLIQIHQNANRAASLVGQLLAFSRKQNLQPETIDLRDTLSDLTHLLNRLVGEKVTLTLDHDPALSQIKADKRQLEQVLMNLVVNARDAMQGAGEIKVETKNLTLRSEMRRDRALVPPGDYVVVKVIDSGHGIAPEQLPKIFEPFFTTKRTGEGTGLGLSTAYGIVKQTGGYIFADSVVGKGTTFSLVFPRFEAPVNKVTQTDSPMIVPLNTAADGVVLLVEDEAPVRAFASRALRLRGYTVLEADCAEMALEMLGDEELNIDVFVTDVIMPGLDGPTWVRQALKQRPNTKVVFVSGYPEDAFEDGQPEIPDAVFLPKPFSLTALTETVHLQLQDASVPVQARSQSLSAAPSATR
ncbi:MAG: ATP-binding protein [Yoonia sp.]|uniref:hybrid sensor histidine kinase/response regulator n=1 Tax=Yoonia sp. TaxID=2212373 RepID=UPI002760B0F6|nr:ATP-binding protein [Yoonia sp.]